MFQFEEKPVKEKAKFDFVTTPKGAVIKVVGVGGGGGNAVNNMINAGIKGVEFIAANTDAQVLAKNLAPNIIHLGQMITKGLGAGGKPEIGQKSAVEDAELIADAIKGADIVFVTAGMGGGTGTGAAPVVASIAKDQGALTIAVVSTPFAWEKKPRMDCALKGLENLKNYVDSYIVVPNERLSEVVGKEAGFKESFRVADDVLRQGVQGITDTIYDTGYINLDCADVRAIMESKGLALMGIGVASGENRDREALEKALKGPLLANTSISSAYGILLNITGGDDFKMRELENIGQMVSELVDEDTIIMNGVVNDGRTDGTLQITLVATGIGLPKAIKLDKYAAKKDAAKDSVKDMENRTKNIRKHDPKLIGIDGFNEEEYSVPTYLRNQVD